MLSLAHGTNDAQKTMGVITLALIAHGDLATQALPRPDWVVISAAVAIALGTYAGGWRIIRTMGTRIIKMDPAQGFAAQSAGRRRDPGLHALRLPALDDPRVSGGIIGAGAAKRLSAVRWGVAGNIAVAWVLTLPAAGCGRRRHLLARGDLRLRRGGAAGDLDHGPHLAGGRAGNAATDGTGSVSASIVNTTTLGKVVLYSLISGVGIAGVFGAGVASAASLADSLRRRRSAASAAWAIVTVACVLCSLAAIVLGIVVIAGG